MPLKNRLQVLMSSEKKDWGTPLEGLFNPIDELFGFDLDVCATEENTKVPSNFITPEEDGLEVDWISKGYGEKKGLIFSVPEASKKEVAVVAWMNPPYGDPEHPCQAQCSKLKCKTRGYHIDEYIPGIGDWVERAHYHTIENDAMVVCLLPARVDTGWFQTVWKHAKLIAFLRHRVRFIGAEHAAPFPNCVAVFTPKRYYRLPDVAFYGMSRLGNTVDARGSGVWVYRGD